MRSKEDIIKNSGDNYHYDTFSSIRGIDETAKAIQEAARLKHIDNKLKLEVLIDIRDLLKDKNEE